MADETAARKAADDKLTEDLGAEIVRAKAAEAELTTAVQAAQTAADNAQTAADAAQDTADANTESINGLTERMSAAEAALEWKTTI